MSKDQTDANEVHAPGRSFAELVAAARRNEAGAMNLLITQCRNYLLLIANQDLGTDLQAKLGASDVVQQAMLSACRNFHQFQGDTEDELTAWMKTILRNDILDARRHFHETQQRDAGREHRLNDSQLIQPQLADPHHTPGTNAVINEQEQILEQAMLQLPQNYQTVIRLRNWDELPFETIGEQLSISADAARKIWSRAIAKLAEILEAAEATSNASTNFRK